MKKKITAIAVAAVFAMAALAGCGTTETTTADNGAASSQAVASETAGTDTAAGSEAASSEAASETASEAASANAGLSGSISMAGSTSMEKLSNALAESFMAKYPGVTVTAEFTGSGAGVEAVAAGSVDIGNASRNLTEEEKAARNNAGELKYSEIRPILAGIVKGGRTPTLMKLVLVCPEALLDGHVSAGAESYLMTVHFQDGALKLTGGISMRTFSMDRTDAQFWDAHFPKVLSRFHILYDL